MLKIAVRILGFLPWIFFFVIATNTAHMLEVAIVVALAATLLFNFRELRHGFILTWASFIFFIVALIFLVTQPTPWLITHVWVIANAVLAAISWGSLLVGKPFTLQFAQQRVDKRYWQTKLFFDINYIITTFWGLVFLWATVWNLVKVDVHDIRPWVYSIIINVPYLLAAIFTMKFPDWYKRRKLSRVTHDMKHTDNPYLKGGYAPVFKEIDADDLEVIGKLPEDLNGVYMRNGPNPQYAPISYTYPFDGDGMIHAVYLEEGKARYRNRFIITQALQAERRAGRALYGGIMSPVSPDPRLLKKGDPEMFKNGAFVNVMRHNNTYLALLEAESAYEITRDLDTKGVWQMNHAELKVNAHYRIDPSTQALYMFTYDLVPPYLTYYRFDRDFQLQQRVDIDKPYSTMMHDMLITQNYIIFVDCPAIFAINNVGSNEPILSWHADKPTRIGLVHRHQAASTPQWFETESFFVFHFANAYEKGHQIIIDYAHHPLLKMLGDLKSITKPPTAYQLILDLKTGQIKQVQIDDQAMEFPRINEQYTGQANRYYYAPVQTNKCFTQLKKYDMQTNTQSMHDFGPNKVLDEAVFAPRHNATAEDDGYVMLFVYDKSNNSSEFVIIDAQHFTEEPVAQVKLPQRVPHGLHGNWMAAL